MLAPEDLETEDGRLLEEDVLALGMLLLLLEDEDLACGAERVLPLEDRATEDGRLLDCELDDRACGTGRVVELLRFTTGAFELDVVPVEL